MDAFKVCLDYFFPGDCYETVLVDLNVFDEVCFKMALGRYLSLAVILGSLMVKVPQIVKIVRSRSIENLSFLAFLLELAGLTFHSSYNIAKQFPFSTWGETLFIGIQVVIILVLMLVLTGNLHMVAMFLPLYGAIIWFLTSEYVSIALLATCQGMVIPLFLSSRATQVVTTFRNGTTGQLSFVTALLNWGGTMSRIFTTLQETKDMLILANYISSFAINSVILLQFLWYWNAVTAPKKKEE